MTYPEDESREEEMPSAGSENESSESKQEGAEAEPVEEKAKASGDKVSKKTKREASSAGKADKADKSTKAEKSAKTDKSGKAEKSTKADKGKKEAKSGKKDKAKLDKPDAGPVEVPRLMVEYQKTVVSALIKKFNYPNVTMVPRLEKIVLNIGVGEAVQNAKLLESAVEELKLISGQKPQITRARRSISNFKLRQGMAIGCRVTLRRWRMWEFLDRLMNIAIPRIRDFRGLPDRSFDGRGNYSMGIREQIIFPEIDMDKIERVHGLDITFVTSARTDEEAFALLTELGVPFRRRSTQTDEQAA